MAGTISAFPSAIVGRRLDQTVFSRKGKLLTGVALQYAGITGQIEDCRVAVSRAYPAHTAWPLIEQEDRRLLNRLL